MQKVAIKKSEVPKMSQYVDNVLGIVQKRNAGEPEFLQNRC